MKKIAVKVRLRIIVIILCGSCCISATCLTAQEADSLRLYKIDNKPDASGKMNEKQQRLIVSGYIQGQYQYGEQDALLKVGGVNENSDEGFGRIGIRRGRIKLAYDNSAVLGVFQMDVTERSIGIKDVYVGFKDTWMKSASLIKIGVFDRPFGYEICYSSSMRESPERSAIFQTLFPEERDLGAMLQLQAPENSAWYFIKLEAGLFAGNGIEQETDNRRDFIGHLSVNKIISDNFSFGLGVSYYNGSVYQGTENVYIVWDNAFVRDNDASNKGRFAKREYFGLDARLSLKSIIGTTRLNGEYIFGQQPGTSVSTKSPNASLLPDVDTYIRNFSGGYAMLVQELGQSPFAFVAKYDWYVPNTKISNDKVSHSTTKADLSQNTLGLGALWNFNSAIRLTAFYDINRNEKSLNPDYNSERNDNVFTLRMQYKF